MEQPVQFTPAANALVSSTVSELYPLALAQMREFAIVLLDTEGVIAWFSPSAEELFGHKLEHVAGKKADLLFIAEDLARGVFQHEMATASAQGSMEDDRWMLRADGSRFWASGVMFPLHGTEKALVGFCKMLRDRTDLKQQLSTLRNEIHALIERGRQKDTVLALAAHEMRNPLFATSVAVDTIRRSVPSAPQQPFDVIDRQLGTMRRLLEDVTDAAQAVTGRLKLKRVRLDLRQVILRALETMRPAIQSRRHIVNEILLPVSIPVEGDPDRLQQVLRNLVDNAVKYTPPGGIIGIKATIEGSEALVQIQDSGMGVAPDMQARIFDLFTQAEQPGDLEERGLGIGLALVKNLVVRHGGTVQVRSNGPGKGSEFSVRLPLAP